MWWVQLATSTLPAASAFGGPLRGGSGHAGWAYSQVGRTRGSALRTQSQTQSAHSDWHTYLKKANSY